MKSLKTLLKSRRKAIAFVDYEYWYYSYKNLWHMTPDMEAWRKSLSEEYQIEDIFVFGDFSSPALSKELEKIRCVPNSIIETESFCAGNKKDMTVFVMLDYIYQAANDKNIHTYILVTGDGHFQPVVKYLVQKKRKQVVVYGVQNSFSRQLQMSATLAVSMPANEEKMAAYYRMIIEDLNYVADKPAIIATFWSTIEMVARKNSVPSEEIHDAMLKMMEEGYIRQKERFLSFNRKVRVVCVDWEKAIADSLWEI